MEGTFELEEGAVSFMRGLLGQREGFLAAHRVVPAGVLEESGDLFHGQVSLVAHGTSAGGAVMQAGEAVDAHLKPKTIFEQVRWRIKKSEAPD